jgi:hypothetical protein
VAEIRVIAIGGRAYTDRDRVARTLQRLEALYLIGFEPEEIVLVHGGCTGADTLAAEEAVKLGWRTEAHPADWATHGTAAGPIRNKHMVSLGAAYAVVFPGGSGTAHCRRLALNARIPVIDVKETSRV